MSRRNEFQNVAAGMAGWFNGRNNAFNGQWAMGFLCAHALRAGTDEVRVDLLDHQLLPANERVSVLIDQAQEKFWELLNKRQLPVTWLVAAEIQVRFHQLFDQRYHQEGFEGEPALCHCKLTDDRGRHYTATAGSICRPSF